jgi:hypothetical protein
VIQFAIGGHSTSSVDGHSFMRGSRAVKRRDIGGVRTETNPGAWPGFLLN